MLFKYSAYNKYRDIKEFLIKYAYFICPLLFIAIYILVKIMANLEIDEEFNSNIINISGILSGFLFSSLGVMMSLPDNKFTQALRKSGYMDIIYNAMFIGIIFLIITLIFGLFKLLPAIKDITFIIGLSETLLSAYYIYKVTKLANKSKQ